MGRGAQRNTCPDNQVECGLFDHPRRHRRNNDLAIPLLLASFRGSRGRKGEAATRTPDQGVAAGAGGVRADTLAGMAFSNVIAASIMITTAATLHAKGVTNIETSAPGRRGPEADRRRIRLVDLHPGDHRHWPSCDPGSCRLRRLRPCRGPALAGGIGPSADGSLGVLSYASGRNSDRRRPQFTPINPIKALYWSAVINGIVAVPVMVILMLMAAERRIMGEFTVKGGCAP
jgi:hypothetical protein